MALCLLTPAIGRSQDRHAPFGITGDQRPRQAQARRMSKDSLAGERLRANYRKYVASNPLFRVDAEWLKAQDPL
ncbi:MAG: hypothetical protein ACXWVH_01250, partial [Caulobacteraceae bacterium]